MSGETRTLSHAKWIPYGALLFAHELRVEDLVLHSREPLPVVLREAHARLSKSPFFDAPDQHELYLQCALA